MKLLKAILLLSILGHFTPNYAKIVQKVEQPETTKSKGWSYTVVEEGDYQIGEAWIHVTSGDSVIVEVYKNSNRVYAIYAYSGEVNRFETRLENLAIGDKITVNVHSTGSAYELEYKTAFATPTFDGLTTFDVADFGARGNGLFNDHQAIANAIQAAKNAGGGIIRFDYSKTYRIEGGNIYALDLSNAKNIKVVGSNPANSEERAKLLLMSPVMVANILNAENVQVEGFIVDYSPLPYWQGEVIGANTTHWTVDVRVYDRYPVPRIDDWDWRFGRTFVPDAPGLRSGDGSHLWVKKVEQLPGYTDGRHLRVYADGEESKTRGAVQDCLSGKATELIMRTYESTSNISYTFSIEESSRILISNFRFYRVPKQGILPQRNYGPITLKDVDFKIPDASEDPVFNRETELFVSWRGHYLTRNNRFGILFDGAEHDGGCMYDDTYNGHVHLALVNAINGESMICSINSNGSNWEIGDWVSLWNHQQNLKYGMARVQNVSYANGNSQITVMLDRTIQGVVPGDATLVNEDLMNRGTEVRNWKISPIGAGRASFRIRTPVIFRDCHFENSFLWPSVEFDREGPRPREVVFKDSYFKGGDIPINITNTIDVTFRRCTIHNGMVQFRQEVNRVLFDSVSWINMSGNIINMEGQDTAWIFGECTRNGHTENLSDWVSLNNQSIVYYSAPPNYLPIIPRADTAILSSKTEFPQNNIIKVYPNPANDEFIIQLLEGLSCGHLHLIDLNGRLILSEEITSNNQAISTIGINKGIYFLSLFASENQYYSKLSIFR